MSEQLQVQVPHGMAWCTGGERVVTGDGATLEELWRDLAAAYPELMRRLSDEDGAPIRWLRVCRDGQLIPHDVPETSLQGARILTMTIIEAAPTAAPMGSRNPF